MDWLSILSNVATIISLIVSILAYRTANNVKKMVMPNQNATNILSSGDIKQTQKISSKDKS